MLQSGIRVGVTVAGQVLDEASAEGDVQGLHASAYPQDGDVPAQGRSQQRQLDGVPLGPALDVGGRVRSLAVGGWGDVRATGEQQPVHRTEGLLDIQGRGHAEGKGDSIRGLQGLDVGLRRLLR